MNRYLRLLERVKTSHKLDGAVAAVDPVAGKLVAREPVRRVLRGDSTGIPLHVIVKDLPFGAWTFAQVLDFFPDDASRQAATHLVGVGLLGVAPAAITGWGEWSLCDKETRRAGIVHAALNGVATVVFLSSWLARRGEHHETGIRLARFGGALLVAAAFVGGNMTNSARLRDH